MQQHGSVLLGKDDLKEKGEGVVLIQIVARRIVTIKEAELLEAVPNRLFVRGQRIASTIVKSAVVSNMLPLRGWVLQRQDAPNQGKVCAGIAPIVRSRRYR